MNTGTKSIRILAVDDHPTFRLGIAGLVAAQSDMCLVAEAANGQEAILSWLSGKWRSGVLR